MSALWRAGSLCRRCEVPKGGCLTLCEPQASLDLDSVGLDTPAVICASRDLSGQREAVWLGHQV